MGSTAGQPQFRNTQPPVKVLHLRNLPWECTEEELIELGRPFGKIVNTMLNVGPNRNQGFMEFEDLNQAISMVSYYASSSEPAQVRGKTVYLQYSNRHEIVNSKRAGDEPSNVLLVTIEGVEAGDVSIDVLHLVFSAFGFVHKIATFEKSAGFQALVQFSDANTAASARSALDGRSIPRYLLAEHVGPCHLRMSFSAHTDLNVKFQSHRSRDYTNPNLPVAPSAIDGTGQFGIGPDGQRREPESNVLLAAFENMLYAVNVDILHMVFSAFGTVQKIAIFEKNAGTQALIQYADVPTAVIAKEALEGHCIYDGGYCKLHLSYSRHRDLNVKGNNDRSRDYTLPQVSSAMPVYSGNQLVSGVHPPPQPGVLGPRPVQNWEFEQLHPASQVASSPMPGSIPNQIYNSSPVTPQPPLDATPRQTSLPVPPYSTFFPGPPPLKNASPHENHANFGMPLQGGQAPNVAAAFSMPSHSNQATYVNTFVGGVSGGGSSAYHT
ncbi:hypothetical protein SUGI_0780350 [Cryptomeria japonica]|nr:hypothetical protein SUGI_0780350 [Cryptomeria japonica]